MNTAENKLVDEISGKNAIFFRPQCLFPDTLNFAWGLNQKRKLVRGLTKTIDLIDSFASRGSALTIIGLFELDEVDGSLHATELTHMLSGGLHEARRCLQKRINFFNKLSLVTFLAGQYYLSIASTLHYFKRLSDRKLREQHLKPKPAIRLPK